MDQFDLIPQNNCFDKLTSWWQFEILRTTSKGAESHVQILHIICCQFQQIVHEWLYKVWSGSFIFWFGWTWKEPLCLLLNYEILFLRWCIWRQSWFSLGRGKKKDTWHRFFRLFTAALLHGSVSALSQISALETSPTPANAYWSLWSAVFWKIDLVLVADEIQRITKHVLYDFLKSLTVGPLLSSRCNFLANFTCSKSPGDSKILIAIYYIENR